MKHLGLRDIEPIENLELDKDTGRWEPKVNRFFITPDQQLSFGFREKHELPKAWSVNYEKTMAKIFRDEWLIRIHRNTSEDINIGTFTVAEKEDKYGNKYYPTDLTLEKNIKAIHSFLEHHGQRSYFFKEATKRGVTHYHAIIEEGAVTIKKVEELWQYGFSNVKNARSKLFAINYVVKKGVFVEGSTLKISV